MSAADEEVEALAASKDAHEVAAHLIIDVWRALGESDDALTEKMQAATATATWDEMCARVAALVERDEQWKRLVRLLVDEDEGTGWSYGAADVRVYTPDAEDVLLTEAAPPLAALLAEAIGEED